MKFKNQLWALWIIIFFAVSVKAQRQSDLELLHQRCAMRGEARISFDSSLVWKLSSEFELLDFDGFSDSRAFFYVSKWSINQFPFHHYPFKLEVIPSMLENPIMAATLLDFTSTWDSYPTYNQYDSLMNAFVNQYPHLCKLHNFGTLASGRKILTLQLTDTIKPSYKKAKFLYTATMHGDETTGYIMMLRLAQYLLQNYALNPEIHQLLQNYEIWINPLANPDGTYYSGNHTVFGSTRYNANSVDINRNFPDPQDGLHPDGKVWQPETQIFMNTSDTLGFTMSANLHGGAEVVNYPWDTWAKLHADDSWWIKVSKQFADTVHVHAPSTYLDMFGTGYTNGYQWYEVDGGRQDYMNYFDHCREFVLEISDVKTLSGSQLPNHWNYLYPSLIQYIQQLNYAINGRVTDSISGKGLVAMVEVLSHDLDSSQVFSNDSGYFFRPILVGNYQIKFSTLGYYPKTLNINLPLDTSVFVDVALVKVPSGFESTTKKIDFKLYPNPAENDLFTDVEEEVEEIIIMDLQGRVCLKLEKPLQNTKSISIESLPSGMYWVEIRTVNGKGIQSFMHLSK